MKGGKPLTIVIKLGTSSIVDEKTHEPLLSTVSLIVETAVRLRKDGHRVVIVSSGAIGVGLRRMNIDKRPKILKQVQALAAIGQCQLMQLWLSLFNHLNQPIGQILITRNDIADRMQYQNAQNTFESLLSMGVIPIVNENDTLAVSEIKFGDNDTLSAITAKMTKADYLFLMTDVECLYTTNPRHDPDAKPIHVVTDINQLHADVSTSGSSLGTGGMGTKIIAARLATSAGITVVITKSSKPGNISAIVEHIEDVKHSDESQITGPLADVPLHTRFTPAAIPVKDRRFWVLYGRAPRGTIYVDEGAFTALSNRAGLLPVGVVDVEGNFAQQEAVKIVVVKRARVATQPLSVLESRSPLRLEQSISSLDELGTPENGSIPGSPTPGSPAAALATGGMGGYENGFNWDSPMTSTTAVAPTMSRSASIQSLSETVVNPIAETIDASVPPREVGRALVNYSSIEISRIKGLRSSEIANVLGYADSVYVAFRENVSLSTVSEGSRHAKNLSTSSSRPVTPQQPMESKMGDLGSFA